jgi:hypothetical protein
LVLLIGYEHQYNDGEGGEYFNMKRIKEGTFSNKFTRGKQKNISFAFFLIALLIDVVLDFELGHQSSTNIITQRRDLKIQ